MMSSESPSTSRRYILSASASITALGAMGAVARAQVPSRNNATLRKGTVLLFQGDSITDDGRKDEVLEADDSKALGRSYAAMISGQLLLAHLEMDLRH